MKRFFFHYALAFIVSFTGMLVGIYFSQTKLNNDQLSLLFFGISFISLFIVFFRLLVELRDQGIVEEEALGLNEEILNLINDGILLVNHRTRRVEQYSRKFLELWKIPQSLADLKDDEKLLSFVLEQLTDANSFIELVEKLYDSPMEESFDILDFVDGRVFERYSKPLVINDEVRGRIWFFRDVTEKRRMEKMVNQSSRLAAIGQLAAGVGHEINNPLAIIKGYVSTILKKDHDISPEIRKKILKVESATNRIAKIVSGLRTFAHIEKTGAPESFSLKALIFEMENMLKEIYKQEGVELYFDTVELKSDVSICGDRGKFEQVLMNLINNAKDATEGGEERFIHILFKRRNENFVEILVSDNGKGVADCEKDKIFDPFYTTKDVGKGTGIGLSLCHKFISDDFRGTIKLKEQKLEKGATFELIIPAERSSKERKVHSEKRKKSPLVKVVFDLRVIIVDDEVEIRALLESIFADFGIETISFENGKLALEEYLMNSRKYDLIVSDMMMPIMNGPTLLNKIRADKQVKQPKFFFTTGGVNIDFEDQESDIYDLIDGYFYKPFCEKKIEEQLRLTFLK